MTAYYNEFDPKAAAWLRQLIKNGDIADGTVDERSIIEVEAPDLKGFTQHHFFAGVGVWSYALRNAGWSDDRPVATASLPCQPFSAAGNQKGKEDERHLLPHFLELVGQCNFHTIFGEQVETAIKHGWLDDLYTEMENQDYSVGSAIIGAHSIGKPHIRKRIYWVAHSASERFKRREGCSSTGSKRESSGSAWDSGQGERMANPNGLRSEGQCRGGQDGVAEYSEDSRVGNTQHDGHATSEIGSSDVQPSEKRRSKGSDISGELTGASGREKPESVSRCATGREREQDSIEWLFCRDQKYRPIKSGIEPLVNGLARGVVHSSDSVIEANASAEARTIRLKGYGNAIVAPVAEEFIRATMEVINQAD
jgi:DNA (cytosine-5)-methyltransferase 1